MQEVGLALNLKHIRRQWIADLQIAVSKALGAKEESYGG